MQGRLQPIFLVSPRYRNEVAAAIESIGRPVVAARRARDAERRFAQSGASIAVVDARGAVELGLGIARALSGTVEATGAARSEEHTSELQSLMRISYAVFCLKKKKSK